MIECCYGEGEHIDISRHESWGHYALLGVPSLTDEVDDHGREFSLCQSIAERLLLKVALYVRIHYNTGQFRVFDQGL